MGKQADRTDIVVVVAFNRLDMTYLEVRNLFGNKITNVKDGVMGLEGGKEMEFEVVYYFKGIGSAAIRFASRAEAQETLERLRNEAGYTLFADPGTPLNQRDVLSVDVVPFAPVDRFTGSSDSPSTDPPTDEDWNLTEINARGTFAAKCYGNGVKIAILDSGISEHGDLNIWGGVTFVNGKKETKNPLDDTTGHGTKCAGIAAGKQGGVARGAELYAVKITNTGVVPAHILLAGLCWCLRNNMDVATISVAGPAIMSFFRAFANAAQALMANNCLIVAGSGDEGANVQFPANSPGLIAVAAYDKYGNILSFSGKGGGGNQVTVGAPGEDIRTTYFRKNEGGQDQYILFTGSSAAAPHVAGAIALYKEHMPGISSLQILSRLISSSALYKGSWTIEAGAGMIDCNTMLAPPNVESDPDPDYSRSVSSQRQQEPGQGATAKQFSNVKVEEIPMPSRQQQLPGEDDPAIAFANTILNIVLEDSSSHRKGCYYVLISHTTIKYSRIQKVRYGVSARFVNIPRGRYMISVIKEYASISFQPGEYTVKPATETTIRFPLVKLLNPDGNGSIKLDITLRNTSTDPSEYYYVALTQWSATARYSAIQRIHYADAASFLKILHGKYSISVIHEYSTIANQTRILTVNVGPASLTYEYPIGVGYPIGKITAVVLIGSNPPDPSRLVTVDGLTDSQFHDEDWTNEFGKAVFRDGVIDDDSYAVKPEGFDPQTCFGHDSVVNFNG